MRIYEQDRYVGEEREGECEAEVLSALSPADIHGRLSETCREPYTLPFAPSTKFFGVLSAHRGVAKCVTLGGDASSFCRR